MTEAEKLVQLRNAYEASKDALATQFKKMTETKSIITIDYYDGIKWKEVTGTIERYEQDLYHFMLESDNGLFLSTKLPDIKIDS